MKIFYISIFCFFRLSVNALELRLEGNTKTKKKVVEVELAEFLKQKVLTEDDVIEIERRLWNLRVFSAVDANLENDVLNIKVEERWTLLPVAKFSGGGGSSYYALGAYDINTMGTNTEVGAQYESLNGRPAGVIWLRKPQFLADRNLMLGVDLWNINRARFFYQLVLDFVSSHLRFLDLWPDLILLKLTLGPRIVESPLVFSNSFK